MSRDHHGARPPTLRETAPSRDDPDGRRETPRPPEHQTTTTDIKGTQPHIGFTNLVTKQWPHLTTRSLGSLASNNVLGILLYWYDVLYYTYEYMYITACNSPVRHEYNEARNEAVLTSVD